MGATAGTAISRTMVLVAVGVVCAASLAGCLVPPPSGSYSLPSVPETLLWGSPYPNLTIRVDHLHGRAPSSTALETMVATLHDVTDKRAIVLQPQRVITGVEGDPRRVWNPETLDDFHEAQFGEHSHVVNGTAFLHVVYLDGVYWPDDGPDSKKTIGLHSGADIYIFVDYIRNEGSVRPIAADRVERSVLIHELGHALGLVNCGVPMLTPREAAEVCHSTNPDSVMYPYARDDQLNALLDHAQEGDWIPYTFDADDLRDLESFRRQGRAASPAGE